jgi:hypothetical protein
MDNPADTLDQADEEILTYTASDEALEAAGGTEISGGSLLTDCTIRFGSLCFAQCP